MPGAPDTLPVRVLNTVSNLVSPRPGPTGCLGPATPAGDGGTVFDAVLHSKGFQELLRTAVLDALRSPEGQDLLAQAIRKELGRR